MVPSPLTLSLRGHFALAIILFARAGWTAEPLPSTVEFNRDVRPILSDACFSCHGPDKAKRKADLRLDREDGAFADLGGYRTLVPGKPGQSELYKRITATDASERMPPARAGRQLSRREIALLRRWIEQGAKWQKHWALLPPRRPPLPPALPFTAGLKDTRWPRNGIDAFVLARLEREGLAPSPEAERATLLRRVTLDLTGLPPTLAEIDAFLADRSPDAYEKVVDRLLASPRYGERMAVPWLDAARYADTNGYQSDGERFMWRWRDWVIDAFNANMPFDQFTIEQLAGDMLPGATLEQKIASGFNRNHRGNGEGGIIPEEYAVEYVVDRVDTTAAVWLGLTLGCARCHDHKYDPFTQKEYYRLFAFFNNVPERGKAIKYGNSPPVIAAPTRAQQEQLKALDTKLQAAQATFDKLRPEIATAQSRWQKNAGHVEWTYTKGLLARFVLDGRKEEGGWVVRWLGGSSTTQPPNHLTTQGRRAADFDGKRYLDAGNVGDFGFYDKFSLAAWVRPRGAQGGVIVSRMTDGERGDGYSLRLVKGKVQLNLVKRWLDDAVRVETVGSLEPGRWHHVLATYDGSRVAAGVRIYVDGRPEPLKINLDDLNQSFRTRQPLRIGAGEGPRNRFHGAIGDVRVYRAALTAKEAELVATPDTIPAILAVPPAKRTPRQARKLRACFVEQYAPAHIRNVRQSLLSLREERARLVESFPTTMVMEEMPRPRPTHVLIRGQYDKPGERVAAGVPAALNALPKGVRNDRLGFARWLVDPSNPLTARVIVNRYWQTFFGIGLVKTAEDFGVQGEWPSHPELLDWLATEFVRRGWNVKAMHRLIVTSAAYRQSSRVSPALLRRDPDNRLLARGPRLRLSAEMIRDQALFVSGLLVERLGGPSVKPYQPGGLWEELAGTTYKQDRGESLYRRSLYTFWKRTVSPPSMVTFDATAREACTVRRSRTNTPLQALTLMNDVTFIEASRVLAERVLKQAGRTPPERLSLAFRLVTARPPRPLELRVLEAGLARHLAHYRKDRAAAEKLVGMGAFRHDVTLDAGELAAYTTMMGLLLNLDEVITRE